MKKKTKMTHNPDNQKVFRSDYVCDYCKLMGEPTCDSCYEHEDFVGKSVVAIKE